MEVPTWRGRVGSALVGAVVGALIGWALSLTQGQRPERWPWMLVGAVLVAGLALLAWERKLSSRLASHQDTDSRQESAPVRVAQIVSLQMQDAGDRQRRLNVLTGLLAEGQTTLEQIDAAEQKNQFSGNAAFIAEQWVTKADDTVREDFGSPDDQLMRSEQITAAPEGYSLVGSKAWQETEKRVRWLRQRVKEERGP